MSSEFKIECEECDNISVVLLEFTEEEPQFCPVCGRRAECDQLDLGEESYDDYEEE